MNSQQHYSPFSPSARKWMITIGTVAIAITLIYAMTTGVISNLHY
jgi:Ni/Fe-hydrogenase subunit HybB-like protein